MSIAPNANGSSRKSFAQVAAAAHKPAPPAVASPTRNESKNKTQSNPAQAPTQSTNTRVEPGSYAKASSQMPTQSVDESNIGDALKAITLEDKPADSPALSSTFRRKDTSDTKSVASRTTLNLDEKESLRPDDSASVQATTDAEEISPAESVAAASRHDFTNDTRAFRDQLNEIDQTETNRLVAQRPIQQAPVASQRNGGIVYVGSGSPLVQSDNVPGLRGIPAPPGSLIFPPDEKLQEALASPKDRLFVLKIEQDFIDLIKNSKESELQLPQTHAFYRMLSHKLAEYYFLGHVVDESLSAVRIYKLPHSRLPPPLIRSEPKSERTTPPPQGSARKIMRRGLPAVYQPGGEGGSTGQTPSSRGQETATNSGSEEDGKGKDKSSLTREEREKQYAEVRARIFEGFAERKSEGAEGGSGSNSKGISRSSSNSGQRKSRKQKKPKDDTFEARSAYSQFPGQPFVNSGFPQPQTDPSLYGGYTGFPYPVASPTFQQSPQAFSPDMINMPGQDFASARGWSGQGFAGPYGSPPDMNSLPNFNPAQHDPANVGFQMYGSPSQTTPKPHHPSLANYYPNQMPNADASRWTQQSFDPACMSPGGMSAAGGAFPMAYGFTQSDASLYNNGSYNGFNAPSFNPQSQSFVPAGAPSGPWSQLPQHMQHQQPPNNPTAYPPSSYANPGTFDPSGLSMSSRSHSHGNSPNPPRQKPPSSRSSSQQQHQQQHQQQQQQQSTPQKDNSISKWATPPSLPAKPPPPSSSLSFQVPKYSENRQPLPNHPFAGAASASASAGAGAANGRA